MSSPASLSSSSERATRYAAWVVKHAASILLLGILATLLFGAVASRLQLKTSFSELLPSHDPGVVALKRTQERMGDLTLLLIGINSPDREANLRYAEALTTKMRALPKDVVQLAAYHVRDLREFFDRNKWLYASEADLTALRDRVKKEIARRKNPLLIDLGDDEQDSDETLRKRLEGSERLGGRFPGGYFSSADGQFVWIAALPPGGLFGERSGEGLFRAAERLIAETPPAGFHPQMHARVAGPIATALASRDAVERDIVGVTATCLLIVGLSIGLYFRRLRAIPLIGLPALGGTLAAFAVAQLAFGYLNASTAFLGSIILGNGINYAIVVMSRYEEHRGVGDPPQLALARAISGTWRATLVAAASTSAAYASLILTSFRGFYQFGVMGAIGALACWAATFTILPSLLALLDRRGGGAAHHRPPLSLGALASLIGKRPAIFVMASTAVTLGATFGLTHFLQDPFEYDFRKLNTKLNTTDEAKLFSQNLDRLFGRWPSPTVILGDSTEEAEQIRAAIRRQDAQSSDKRVIGQIATIWDLLPGTPEAQTRKLALLADLRRLVRDPLLETADDDEKKKLKAIDPPEDLRVLGPMDVPTLARRPFTEVNGEVGRVVLVYPPEGRGLSVWNGRDLLRIAKVLQRIELPGGKVIETSGSAVVFGAMIRSILRDGPIATVASLAVVVAIILASLRRGIGALALATLAVGVVWMVGTAGLAGVRVTFLNFIALPITFGIGTEYALNVVARYKEEGDPVRAVSSTGGAVALCSWTTIVGYGSLLAAHTQALQGFGAMAILGEVACLAAAIVTLPAFLVMRGARPGESPGQRPSTRAPDKIKMTPPTTQATPPST